MRIEKYKPEFFDELAELLKEHNSIARRTLVDFPYERLSTGLESNTLVTFCVFVDDKMTSFMISRMIEDHPSWFVWLVVGKKSAIFNPQKNGICALYDVTIPYWEDKGIKNFLYIQPSIFLSRGNEMTRAGSPKLQEYIPYNYHVIPANTESPFALVRNLVRNLIFEEDMIVRWCFKNEK